MNITRTASFVFTSLAFAANPVQSVLAHHDAEAVAHGVATESAVLVITNQALVIAFILFTLYFLYTGLSYWRKPSDKSRTTVRNAMYCLAAIVILQIAARAAARLLAGDAGAGLF